MHTPTTVTVTVTVTAEPKFGSVLIMNGVKFAYSPGQACEHDVVGSSA